MTEFKPGDKVRQKTPEELDATPGFCALDHNSHLAATEYDVARVLGAWLHLKDDPMGEPIGWMAERFVLAQGTATPDPSLALDPGDAFDAALIDVITTNRAKRKDYVSAGASSIFENFESAAADTDLPVEKVLQVLIAIKRARLRALEGREGEALHESVEDTVKDMTVYTILLRAWRLSQQ